jgi:hypothetical protein
MSPPPGKTDDQVFMFNSGFILLCAPDEIRRLSGKFNDFIVVHIRILNHGGIGHVKIIYRGLH